MKIGRNVPCPCGSGKKYKKCCLATDEEERLKGLKLSNSEAPEWEDPGWDDSDEEEWEADVDPDPFWQEFKDEDLQGRVALLRKAMREQPEELEDDTALEMLSDIDDDAFRQGRFQVLDDLIEALKECLPDLYRERASSYLRRRINNAFAGGRPEAVRDLAVEFASLPNLDPDHFSHSLDQMAYHGQLDTLLEARRLAWPSLRDSENIMAWAIDAFAIDSVDCVFFDHCRRHPDPDPSSAELHRELEFYEELEMESIERVLASLSGQSRRIWTRRDFDWKPSRKTGCAKWSDQRELGYLTQEFLGELHRREGVSFTRGELGRFQLWRYILKRFNGDLTPRESLWETMMSPKKRTRREVPQADHPLCPDPETLDRHLDGLLDFLAPQFYKAAALLELIPAWLRFLESRQLIEVAEKAETLYQLQDLHSQMSEFWENHTEDPALASELRRCWADAV